MTDSSQTNEARLARGTATLQKIGGPEFDRGVKPLAAVSPDMAAYTIAFGYGDVLSRPGLDLRTRQLCTVSMLIAQGSVQPQLRFHMEGTLNVGGSVQDLVEILVISTAILGFPAAIDSIGILRAIIEERGISFTPQEVVVADLNRHPRGRACLFDLLGESEASYTAGFAEVSPILSRWAIEFAFGEVLSREGLTAPLKQLSMIAMLATAGNRAELLQAHIRGALRRGVTREQIVEVFIQLSVYAGFPTALNAFNAARAVFAETAEPVSDRGSDESGLPAEESRAARHARGIKTLAATSGATGAAVVRSFDDIAPEIGAWIVEHSYGEIFSRRGLDPKTRELTTCAAMAGSFTAASEKPLRVHIIAALNLGASRDEIIETLLNVVSYRGYPAVQRAMVVAGEAFREAGVF